MRYESWVEFTREYAAEQLEGLVDDVAADSERPGLHPDECEIIATYMKNDGRRYSAQVVTKQLMSSFDERQDWMEFFKSVIRYDLGRAA